MDTLQLARLKDIPNHIVSWKSWEAPLVVLFDLKLATPAILDGRAAQKRPRAGHDGYLADYIRTTRDELKA